MGKKEQSPAMQTRRSTKLKTARVVAEPHIALTTKVWQKDSHGLFDYDSKEDQYESTTQKIIPFKRKGVRKAETDKESRIFICRNRECKTHILHAESENTDKLLRQMLGVCEVISTKKKNKVVFKVRTALRLQNFSSLNESLKKQLSKSDPTGERQQELEKQGSIKIYNPQLCPFTVAKDYHRTMSAMEGYPLRAGNIIKFGRVQYLVVEVKTSRDFVSIREGADIKNITGFKGIYEVPEKKKREEEVQNHLEEPNSKGSNYVPTCKVCLCSEETDEDILISPCNCKGYCGMIHIGCLKQWINSKVKRENHDIVQSYNFNRFECEICKMPLPQLIKQGERIVEMMKITKPDKPYIMIESINPPFQLSSHSREEERCLHVITFGQKGPLRIGRGHNCEIRISDISVSRSHAEISMSDNKFLIRDSNSKFGTLILFDDELVINEKFPLKIQSGRCLYELKYQKQPIESIDRESETESENMQPEEEANIP